MSVAPESDAVPDEIVTGTMTDALGSTVALSTPRTTGVCCALVFAGSAMLMTNAHRKTHRKNSKIESGVYIFILNR